MKLERGSIRAPYLHKYHEAVTGFCWLRMTTNMPSTHLDGSIDKLTVLLTLCGHYIAINLKGSAEPK